MSNMLLTVWRALSVTLYLTLLSHNTLWRWLDICHRKIYIFRLVPHANKMLCPRYFCDAKCMLEYAIYVDKLELDKLEL